MIAPRRAAQLVALSALAAAASLAVPAAGAFTRLTEKVETYRITTDGPWRDDDTATASCDSGDVLIGCHQGGTAHRACDGGYATDSSTCLAHASGRSGSCYGYGRCAVMPSGVSPTWERVQVSVSGDDETTTASCPSGSVLFGLGFIEVHAGTDGIVPDDDMRSFTLHAGSGYTSYGYGYCVSGMPVRDQTIVSNATDATAGSNVSLDCPSGYKIAGMGMRGAGLNCQRGTLSPSLERAYAETSSARSCTGYAICIDYFRCGDRVLDRSDNAEECDSSTDCNTCLYAAPALSAIGYYDRIEVEWGAICSSNSASCPTPDGYHIEWRDSGASTGTHVDMAATSTSTTLAATFLTPGTDYEVRIKAYADDVDPFQSDDPGIEDKFSAWQTVRTSCDCEGDLDRDGAPHSLAIEQDGTALLFSFADPSACNEQTVISFHPSDDDTNVAQVGIVTDSIGSCAETDVVQSSIQALTSQLDLGREYVFSVGLVSALTDYSVSETFLSQFVGSVQVIVQADNGLALTGARVTLRDEASGDELVSATIDAAAPDLTAASDVSATADFSSDGVILAFQTGRLTTDTVNVVVGVEHETSGLVHTFKCVSSGSACTSDTVEAAHLGSAPSSVFFVDEAVFSVSGTVVLDGTGGACGSEGVTVCLVDTQGRDSGADEYEWCIATDSSGAYTLSAAVGTSVEMTASREGHTIEASNGVAFSLLDHTTVDFLDTTTATLTVALGGGDCLINIGTYKAIAVANNCQTFFQDTGDVAALTTTLSLPAQPYTVGVDEDTDPGRAFNGFYTQDTIDVDLGGGSDSEARFVFNKELDPATDISVTQTDNYNGGCTDVFVADQGRTINVTVSLNMDFGTGSTCSLMSGTARFFDRSAAVEADCADAGTDAGCEQPLVADSSGPVQQTTATFSSTPQYPQVLGSENYRWEQKVEVLLDGFAAPVEFYWSVIVIGHQQVGDAFTMNFPSYVPLMVLHDPPGGNSFAQLSRETTVSTDITLTLSTTDSEASLDTYVFGLDKEIEVCAGVGVEACEETYTIEATVGGSVDSSADKVTSESTTSSTGLTTRVTLTTSADPTSTGDAADMFLIPTLSVLYSLTDAITFDSVACVGVYERSIAWAIDTESDANSFTWASTTDIEDVIIPELEEAYALEEDAAKKALLKNATDGWLQTLADNAANKAAAQALEISFDGESQSQIQFFGGGSSVEYAVSTVSSTTSSREVTVEISEESALELVAIQNIVGVVIGTTSSLTYTLTTGNTTVTDTTTESVDEWLFVLSDPDAGDDFLVEIRQDPVYGTPVFSVLGGESSCMGEPGTELRHSFSALVDPTRIDNVLESDVATFTLEVTNVRDLEYVVGIRKKVESDSSPIVTLVGEGQLSDTPRSLVLPALQATSLLLEVQSNTIEFSFEDIEIEVVSQCEYDLDGDYQAASVYFSATFIAPCPAITWGFASDEYTSLDGCSSVLLATDQEFDAVVFNPEIGSTGRYQDLARVESVQLEYTTDEIGFWLSALDSDGNVVDLSENDATGISTGTWDISGLAEGEYRIRAAVTCTDSGLTVADVSETEELTVLVDVSAPTIFGTPEPADLLYWPGDAIAIRYSEALSCGTFEWAAMIGGASDENCFLDFGTEDQVTNYLISNPVPDGFPSTALSVVMWVRAPASTADGSRLLFLLSYATEDNSNEILLAWRPSLRFEVFIKGTKALLETVKVPADEWHHFVVTWDSADGSGAVYVDGLLAVSFVLEAGSTIEPGGSLVVGQEQDAVGGGFQAEQALLGEVENLSIWFAALTADEVATIYGGAALSGTERGLFAGFTVLATDVLIDTLTDLNGNMPLEVVGDVAVTCNTTDGALSAGSHIAMDVLCSSDTIEFAFPFGYDVSALAGQVLTITVDGATDAVGSPQPEAYSWSFVVDDSASYSLVDLVVSGVAVAADAARGGHRPTRQLEEPEHAEFVANFRAQTAGALGIGIERIDVMAITRDSQGNFIVDFAVLAGGEGEPTALELAPLLSTIHVGPTQGDRQPAQRPSVSLVTPEFPPGELPPGSEADGDEGAEDEAVGDEAEQEGDGDSRYSSGEIWGASIGALVGGALVGAAGALYVSRHSLKGVEPRV